MFDAYRPKNSAGRHRGLMIATLVHVLLAWLLISGTGHQAMKLLKKPLEAVVIQEVIVPPPPPPKEIKPPEPKAPRVEAPPPPPFVPPPEVVPPPSAAPAIESMSVAPSTPRVIAPQKQDIRVVCPQQTVPEMPSRAIQEGTQGVVKAQLLIVDGKPKQVDILSGPRVFHAAVRNAMMNYGCTGRGEVRATQEFNFKIDE